MKNIIYITRKELHAFFASPIAYVITVVFSALMGFFFYNMLWYFNAQAMQIAQNPYYLQQVNINQMVFAPLLGNMIIILLLILPLLTMRLFSEEKKNGTDELLFTSPLSMAQISLGKYLASLIVLFAMLALSMFLSVFVFAYGNPEPLPILTGYLALFLTGATFIAFGVFFSALTENQIISAILSFGTLLIFWVLSWASGMVGGLLRSIFDYVSIFQHFEDMTRGVLDTKDITYYLSLIFFLLFLTIWVLHSRWWRQNIKKFGKSFSLLTYIYLELLFLTAVAKFLWPEYKALLAFLLFLALLGLTGIVIWLAHNFNQVLFWINKLLIVILTLGIIVLINLLGIRHNLRADFTEAKLHSLSDQSVTVIKNLKTDVAVKSFFREGSRGRSAMENLLKIYAYHSPRIKFEFIDPDRNPALVKQYDITQEGTTVFEAGGRKSRITDSGEEDITNALIQVTRARKKVIYFLEGHGEATLAETGDNGFATAKAEFEKLGYEVKKQTLALAAGFPKDCALLIVPGPQKDLLPNEIETIKGYIQAGGRVLFMVDPETQIPGLAKFLAQYGFKLDDDLIVDTVSRLLGGDYFMPVVSEYEDHAITRKFNYATFYPYARSVEVGDTKPEGETVTALAKTSPNSWAERELNEKEVKFTKGKDRQGPVTLAAVASLKVKVEGPPAAPAKPGEKAPEEKKTEEKEARLAVVGDSDFAKNRYFNLSGNGNFFLNIANWLTEESDLISIQPKTQTPRLVQFTEAQGKFIGFFAIFLLSLPVRILGVSVWLRRRSL